MINTFGIGDVLFTTPVIASLKKAIPNSRISYIANSRTAVFLCHDPRIDEVFVYERDEFVETYRQSKMLFLKKWARFLSSLRRQRFDCVIDFSMNRQFSFLTMILGIPCRVGFDYKNRGSFLTHKIPLLGFEGKHVVDYYCDLLSLIDVPARERKMEIYLSSEAKAWAKTWLLEKGLANKKRLVALVPGGGASWGKDAVLKRWPREKYAQLVAKVVEKINVPIILFGEKCEQSICQEIASHVNSSNIFIAPEIDLLRFAALLGNCQLAIVNDGGPLHVAVAQGVQTLSIFGPVDEKVYGPYLINQHIVVQKHLACQPCYRRFRMTDCQHQQCLKGLSVDDVFRKVEKVL